MAQTDTCFLLGSRLRQAISAGDYAEARTLLGEFSAAVESAWSEMEATDPRALILQAQTEEVLHWGLQMVSADRAQSVALLGTLPNPGGYASSTRSESFSVDA